MNNKYFDVLDQVDFLLQQGPRSPDVITELEKLLKNEKVREYFLNQLHTPEWISYLRGLGYFSNPPSSIKRGSSVYFPIWPESRFLLRVVELKPDEVQVREIALELPDTDNVRVHEDFTQAACKMPPNSAAKWAHKEIEWIKRQGTLYLNLSTYLGELVAYLASKNETETALQLAQSVLELQSDPDYEKKYEEEKKKNKESEYYLPYTPEPRAKFDRWDYEEFLKNHIPPLVEAGQLDTFKWLCDLLANANDYSLRKDDEVNPKDFSYIWRPAIEESDQNMKHDVRDALIESVRDAAEKLIEQDSENLVSILEILNNQRYQKWSIFRRIALHLVRVEPSVEPVVVKHYLRNMDLFEDHNLHHEYQLLIRDRFDELAKPDQDEIIGWVLAGEQDRIKRVKDWYQEKEQREPSPQELDKGVNIWLRDELAQFAQYLRGDLKDRYDAAVQSEGEADHPEFPSYSTSWVGPTSPKSSDELGSWSVQNLLVYLKSWQPTGDWMTDSLDGLADAIANAVGKKPEKYAGHCNQFYQLHPQLHPKYIRGFIEGFNEAASNDKSFHWSSVLTLCQWIVDQNRAFSLEVLAQEIGDGREETSWAWTLRRIANLLEEGLKQKKNAEISFKHRETVWAILEVLANDPDPSPQEEHRMMQPFDPSTISINTVRGLAMHSVMHFVMWVRKHLGEQVEGDEKPVLDFSTMPEVRRLLERRLDRRSEKTLTIQSVYAKWFPWLVAWDIEWSKKYKRKIFPGSPTLDKYWKTAWGTYIIYNRPYDNVFRVLKRDYRKALRRLDTIQVELIGASSVDESLAEHLMTFYWRGLIARKSNSLINQFFALAPPELRGHAIGFIGDNIAHTDASIHPDIMQRFYDLWSWRLRSAKIADDINDYKPELMAFGRWFGTQKLQPVEWALEQVLQVLNMVERIDADEAMVKYLAVLAEKYPIKVIDCFRLMALDETDGYKMWLWQKHGKRLLSTIITGTNLDARVQAIDLVHRLGAMGHQEFRDLLQD